MRELNEGGISSAINASTSATKNMSAAPTDTSVRSERSGAAPPRAPVAVSSAASNAFTTPS